MHQEKNITKQFFCEVSIDQTQSLKKIKFKIPQSSTFFLHCIPVDSYFVTST
jgi:hypothetical protein